MGRGSGGGGRGGGRGQNVAAQVMQTERDIAQERLERAVAFDAQGRKILDKGGTINTVEFTRDEILPLTGAVFTHNHPSGSSFSPEDALFAVNVNLKEMRAVGHEVYTKPNGFQSTRLVHYSMTPEISPATKAHGKQRAMNTINREVQRANQQVRAQFTREIQQGTRTIQQAENTHWDTVWKTVEPTLRSQGISLNYTRTVGVDRVKGEKI